MTEKDKAIISMIYFVVAEQNSAIWDKLSDKKELADRRVKKLIPQMMKLEMVLKDWMDEKTN